MHTVLMILLGLSLLSVAGILIAGFVVMTRGGAVNAKYGNKLMRARVIAQAIAIILFMLMLAAGQQGQ